MYAIKVIYAIVFIISILGVVYRIGKDREPISSGDAVFILCVYTPIILILIFNK